MKPIATNIVVLLVLAVPTLSYGHGTPIDVDVIDGKLTVTGGIVDAAGYAYMVFADPLEDTALSPAPGNFLLTDFPGLTVHGMDPGAGLYLQPIPRPVLGASPVEERLLWYWNPTTEQVELAPNGESLNVLSTRSFGQLTLPQSGQPAPGELKIAEPRESDLDEHRHYLYYALDNDPAAASGAYGFFARLNSPAYAASDPFLIAFNSGLSPESFETAALAINAAAIEPAGLAGDYNASGVVEQGDLDLVLLHWGAAAATPPNGWLSDLPAGQIDQDELDGVLLGWGNSATTAATPSAVPEPSTLLLFCALVGFLAVNWPR